MFLKMSMTLLKLFSFCKKKNGSRESRFLRMLVGHLGDYRKKESESHLALAKFSTDSVLEDTAAFNIFFSFSFCGILHAVFA